MEQQPAAPTAGRRPHTALDTTGLSPVHPTLPSPTQPIPSATGDQQPKDAREFVRSRGRPRVCPGCGVRPVAFTVPRIDVCFVCLPGGPHTPPPCTVCGCSGFFFHQGLCTGCHPFSPDRRDACPDCYAWGTSAASRWRCWGCLDWHRKFSRHGPGGPCAWCRRTVALNRDRACRMCWQQRARLRRATGNPHASYEQALDSGWVQLSIANTRPQERRPTPARVGAGSGPEPVGDGTDPAAALPAAVLVPFSHRQLVLFEPPPRLVTASTGVPLDPVLAGWLQA